mgnify:FL=1
MNKSNLILASVSAIIFTSILIIFSPTSKKTFPSSPTPSPILTESISPTPNPTADWKTYNDELLKVEFKYPSHYIQEITQNNSYYSIDLLGSDYQTIDSGMGTQRRGTFFIITENPKCNSGAIIGETLITSNKIYTIYKINGYEGPDYKSAVIKKPEGGCLSFGCMSENLCEESIYEDFVSILSTFKFTQ